MHLRYRIQGVLTETGINPAPSCTDVFTMVHRSCVFLFHCHMNYHTMFFNFLNYFLVFNKGFPGGSVIKESACQCRRCRFEPWVRKIP